MSAPTIHGDLKWRREGGLAYTPCCYRTWGEIAEAGGSFTGNVDEVTCKPFRSETLAMQQWRLSVAWSEFTSAFVANLPRGKALWVWLAAIIAAYVVILAVLDVIR